MFMSLVEIESQEWSGVDSNGGDWSGVACPWLTEGEAGRSVHKSLMVTVCRCCRLLAFSPRRTLPANGFCGTAN